MSNEERLKQLTVSTGQEQNPQSRLLHLWEKNESKAANDTRRMNAATSQQAQGFYLNADDALPHLTAWVQEQERKKAQVEPDPRKRLVRTINKWHEDTSKFAAEIDGQTIAVPPQTKKKLEDFTKSIEIQEQVKASRREQLPALTKLEFTIE